MDSTEPGTLAPLTSQYRRPPPPSMIMTGSPNMYTHSLFSATSSLPNMMTPNSSVLAMMQNYYLSLGHVDPSPPSVQKLQEQFPIGPTFQNQPFEFGGPTSQHEPFGSGAEPVKKKRGRPRKYPSVNNNNNKVGMSLISNTSPSAPSNSSVMPINQDSPTGGSSNSNNPAKRKRGRPRGSVKKRVGQLGSSGFAFMPHVLFVEEGEDIMAKIYAFSQEGPRIVFVGTVSGVICNATLVQPPLSDLTLTYNSPLEILSIYGSFSPPQSNGILNQAPNISVVFAGRDGQLWGGQVSGGLIAATKIQMTLASFNV